MYVNILYMDVALSRDARDHQDYMFGLPVTPHPLDWRNIY